MNPDIGSVGGGSDGYSLQVGCGAHSPADATTYYIGGTTMGLAANSTDGNGRIYIAKAGRITKVFLRSFNTGTNGTTEASAMYIRKNSTTDYLLSDTIDTSASVNVQKTDLSIPVAQGDFIEVKWVCPTWVTNPTNVRWHGNIFVEA